MIAGDPPTQKTAQLSVDTIAVEYRPLFLLQTHASPLIQH